MAAIAVFSGIPTGTSNLEPSRYSLPALASLIGWSSSTIKTGASFVPLVGRVLWALVASVSLTFAVFVCGVGVAIVSRFDNQ